MIIFSHMIIFEGFSIQGMKKLAYLTTKAHLEIVFLYLRVKSIFLFVTPNILTSFLSSKFKMEQKKTQDFREMISDLLTFSAN